MSLEQTACEDLKAFERRLTEVIACLQPSTIRWRIVLLAISLCVAAGASQWLLDPATRVVPLFHSLLNHPFFMLSTIALLVIFALGVHKRVIAASIITSRTREVLCDFNMSCDENGKLILKPRPANITYFHRINTHLEKSHVEEPVPYIKLSAPPKILIHSFFLTLWRKFCKCTMSEQHRFGTNVSPITCHAWNGDKTQIAFSPNNNEVHIYERTFNDWKLVDVLNQHDLRVMDVDWAPKTNRIVTCAVDRNAYVWTQGEDKKWKPTLVLLRINRAATCVKWSPKENKFAVGSGARLISVCYFESENDWWVSKHIKKPIRSTITSIDWHPNNILLVAGSADFMVRVFSAYIKDIEKTPETTPWGTKMSLGQLMAEFPNSPAGGGWVHSVSFSPDGNKVCWVSHDSSINVADASKGNAVAKLKTEFLPILSCTWISNNSIIAAGHSCIPLLFSLDANGKLFFNAKLDNSQKKEAGGLTAMRKFQSLDKQARTETSDTNLDSIHQNAITCLCLYSGTKQNASKFSTSGLDGQLVIWDINSLERAIQGLKVY